ncbi:MAG: hypothetical protein EU548_00590 [Promethearchaeota archaeon]|nr:MAG: hypothetical protein EU548_00590 [Candidatus Lokiarchaeota archaeon]
MRKSRKRKEFFTICVLALISISILLYFHYTREKFNVPSNLPKVYITCQHNIRRNVYKDCVVEIDYDSTIGKIKIRGVRNYFFPKQEYRLQLSEQKSFLNMRTDDDWILFAMYNDFTGLRIKLCFDLWRSLEPTDATAILPKSEYVNLYINNEYKGLYLLAEKDDRKLFDLDDYQKNTKSSFIFKINSVFNFTNYNEDAWEQNYPDIEEYNLKDKILPDLTSFIEASSDLEFFDPKVGIYSKFDKKNLIDFFIFNHFIYHGDFWNRNIILLRNTSPSKYILIPWDFDASFGQYGELTNHPRSNTSKDINAHNYLFRRLINNRDFMWNSRVRWLELREELWTEDYIMNKLFNYYKDIKESLKISMTVYDLDKKIDRYVDYLIDWIPERLEYCDEYFLHY